MANLIAFPSKIKDWTDDWTKEVDGRLA
jgi:hypothetical protein